MEYEQPWNMGKILLEYCILYTHPLVNVYITRERSTMLLMGKSTISTGPFSIANC